MYKYKFHIHYLRRENIVHIFKVLTHICYAYILYQDILVYVSNTIAPFKYCYISFKYINS